MHYEGDVTLGRWRLRRRAVHRAGRRGRVRCRAHRRLRLRDPRLGRVGARRHVSRLGWRQHRGRDHRRRSVVAQLPARPDRGRHVDGLDRQGEARHDRRPLLDRRHVQRHRDAPRAAEGGVRTGDAVERAPLVQGRLPRPLGAERRRRGDVRSDHDAREEPRPRLRQHQRPQHRRAARADRGGPAEPPRLLVPARRRDHDVQRPRQRGRHPRLRRAPPRLQRPHRRRHHRRRRRAGRHLHRQPPDARPRRPAASAACGSTSTTRRGTRSRAWS